MDYLTEAEDAVVAALVSGLTVQQIAAARGVTVTTVRAQVRTIFDKLGVRRQVDLVRRQLSKPCRVCGHKSM
jgi:DNA-binding NarL/FixJ family response regulator